MCWSSRDITTYKSDIYPSSISCVSTIIDLPLTSVHIYFCFTSFSLENLIARFDNLNWCPCSSWEIWTHPELTSISHIIRLLICNSRSYIHSCSTCYNLNSTETCSCYRINDMNYNTTSWASWFTSDISILIIWFKTYPSATSCTISIYCIRSSCSWSGCRTRIWKHL